MQPRPPANVGTLRTRRIELSLDRLPGDTCSRSGLTKCLHITLSGACRSSVENERAMADVAQWLTGRNCAYTADSLGIHMQFHSKAGSLSFIRELSGATNIDHWSEDSSDHSKVRESADFAALHALITQKFERMENQPVRSSSENTEQPATSPRSPSRARLSLR